MGSVIEVFRFLFIAAILALIVSVPYFLFMMWTILSDIADHVECMHSHMADRDEEIECDD